MSIALTPPEAQQDAPAPTPPALEGGRRSDQAEVERSPHGRSKTERAGSEGERPKDQAGGVLISLRSLRRSDHLRDLRRERWRRRNTSARFLSALDTPPIEPGGYAKKVRPATCGWTISAGVSIMSDGTRPAGFRGLVRCASMWCCPHCGAVLRAGRAQEIEKAVTSHQKDGGELLFFTGTLRHRNGDDLKATLNAVMEAWRSITATYQWKKRKKALEINGYIRSIEVTYGNHGWHPHAHLLLFLDRKLSEDERADFKAWLFSAWAEAVVRAGGRRPTQKGMDLQDVDKKGKVLAQYIGKIQEEKKWGASKEMARSDLKRARGASLNPLELLDDDCGLEEKARIRLWCEFYEATKGRRAITWSRGLKARFEIGEKEDAEVLDEAESTALVWVTSAKAYRDLKKSDSEKPVRALELAEEEDWEELEKLLPAEKSWRRKFLLSEFRGGGEREIDSG